MEFQRGTVQMQTDSGWKVIGAIESLAPDFELSDWQKVQLNTVMIYTGRLDLRLGGRRSNRYQMIYGMNRLFDRWETERRQRACKVHTAYRRKTRRRNRRRK